MKGDQDGLSTDAEFNSKMVASSLLLKDQDGVFIEAEFNAKMLASSLHYVLSS